MADSTIENVAMSSLDQNVTDGDSDYEDLPSPDGVIEEVDDASHEGHGKLAFSTIHDTPKAFKELEMNMLIPGASIKVKVIDIERTPATHMINPNLYVLQLTHCGFQWIIKRRYKHFHHLHQELRLFRTTLSIPIPTKKHKARRKSCKKVERSRLPRFPKKPDALLSSEKVPERAQQLEDYLKNLLRIPLYRNHHEMMSFLEISPLSFINELGEKRKEGLVQKRSLNQTTSMGCFRFKRGFIDWCGRWRWRWLLIKDTFIAYINPKTGKIKSVMLMDRGSVVDCGFVDTGIHHGLHIKNLSRRLLVRCWTRRKAREWHDALGDAIDTAKSFTRMNVHSSFAPARNSQYARWFIDGATYFEAVAEALEKAKEEIFIADWWLSPELYMKRPVMQGEIWRLDHILKRKAQQGVKIFILLYKEVEMALGINSLYSKQQLVSMHPNIKVLRHPDHVKNGTLLWAHHEKLVCIDQSFAFLGGIDLCYGRWDDYHHRLTDLGGVVRRPSQTTLAEGIKAETALESMAHIRRSHSMSAIGDGMGSNPPSPLPEIRSKDETDCIHVQIKVDSPTPTSSQILTPSPTEEKVASSEDPEYPSSHLMDNEELARKRYTSRKLKAKMVMQAVVRLQGLKKQAHNKSLDSLKDFSFDSLDLPDTDMRRTTSELALNELGLQGNAKFWIGKDYINFIIKDFEHLHKPYQDLIDRQTTPRMPWHDIGCYVEGAAARDVARHFIERWNFTKCEKAKYYDRYPWLLPKTYEDIEFPHLQISSTKKLFLTKCQVLRSASTWSAGIIVPECSILNAYINAIQNAKHYIYIENQFFITRTSDRKDVYNSIGEELFKRILQAHKNKETFRVYVVMPLLPAFEGEIGTGTGTAIQAITHWNYVSICRGPDSLYHRLQQEVGDPSNYITFYGLRQHGVLNEKLKTELVYVHSKMLIVDDKTVIIGSANINDRSLFGTRDSEMALLVEDETFETSVMNEKPYSAGKFAFSLRRTLFSEHLGLLDKNIKGIDVRDPVSDSFYKDVWIKSAALNTSIYGKVFRCIPSDEVRSFSELREYLSKPNMATSDPAAASSLLTGVQGHLVLIPFFFLCNENLTPSAGTKERLMPVSLWT